MFGELTDKLEAVFKSIRGHGKLTEQNIKHALRDIRRALLEADVNFKVAKHFIESVQDKALGTEVFESITPGQLIVKIVHDELIKLLGEKDVRLQIKGSPEIFMVCGLQGSGKTTTIAKLAHYFRKNGRNPMVSSVDVYRPAAIDQLRVLARNNKITFFECDSDDPVSIAAKAIEAINTNDADVLLIDTAGRLHIDNAMMEELSKVRNILNPHHVLFVADGMTGQDAVNAVEGFIDFIDFDGVILTKLDSDTRGGAALSIRHVTGKPILFVGTGERIEALDVFYPDRYASRILGMGDIVSLVEKAQDVVDEKNALKLQKKMLKDGMTFEDFLDQLNQIRNMGPLDQLLGMIPGVGKMMKGIDLSGNDLKRVEAIILSMTKEERKTPGIINGSRRRRIAAGSGTSIQDVNNLLKQFNMMQKMMKKMPKMGGQFKSFPGMRLPFK
ncbi:MAG: signal recognition particle protein [Candidatus Latescibacteria bacterium]|nr:signal recognition particle protein [Candidatus Latescibacterota bacterium]